MLCILVSIEANCIEELPNNLIVCLQDPGWPLASLLNGCTKSGKPGGSSQMKPGVIIAPQHLPPAHLPAAHLPPEHLSPVHLPPAHLPPAHLPPAHLPGVIMAPAHHNSGQLPTPIKEPGQKCRIRIHFPVVSLQTKGQNFHRLETMAKEVNNREITDDMFHENEDMEEKESENSREGIKVEFRNMLDRALKMHIHKMAGPLAKLPTHVYQSKYCKMPFGGNLHQYEDGGIAKEKHLRNKQPQNWSGLRTMSVNQANAENLIPKQRDTPKPRMLKTKQNLGHLNDKKLAAKLSKLDDKPPIRNVKLRFQKQENVLPMKKDMIIRIIRTMTNKMTTIPTMRSQAIKNQILREMMTRRQIMRFPKMLQNLIELEGGSARDHQCFYNPTPCF